MCHELKGKKHIETLHQFVRLCLISSTYSKKKKKKKEKKNLREIIASCLN